MLLFSTFPHPILLRLDVVYHEKDERPAVEELFKASEAGFSSTSLRYEGGEHLDAARYEFEGPSNIMRLERAAGVRFVNLDGVAVMVGPPGKPYCCRQLKLGESGQEAVEISAGGDAAAKLRCAQVASSRGWPWGGKATAGHCRA